MEPGNIIDSQGSGGSAVVFDDVGVVLEGITILDGISATVPCGGSTAIVGPNRAGKTTLLLVLLGQLPYTGSIRIHWGAAGQPEAVVAPHRIRRLGNCAV